MVKIIYVDSITFWISLGELRDRMIQTVIKGFPLKLTANLSNQCQLALLKFIEERPDTIIITSTRLSWALESRSEVQGRVPVRSDPNFMGLTQFDHRISQALTLFANWR